MTLFVACAHCLGAAVSAEAETQAAGQFPALDAAIVARMRKHGLPGLSLALVAQVRRYIPWFAVGDEAASDAITTRHLILHASGLSDAGFPLVLPDEAPLENAVRSLRAARPTAPVGARHRYFYLGYTVLAYLIELVSGQSYADYLRDHILTPLSMLDTTASPEEAVGLSPRLFALIRLRHTHAAEGACLRRRRRLYRLDPRGHGPLRERHAQRRRRARLGRYGARDLHARIRGLRLRLAYLRRRRDRAARRRQRDLQNRPEALSAGGPGLRHARQSRAPNRPLHIRGPCGPARRP